jgi:hypothetical protein
VPQGRAPGEDDDGARRRRAVPELWTPRSPEPMVERPGGARHAAPVTSRSRS